MSPKIHTRHLLLIFAICLTLMSCSKKSTSVMSCEVKPQNGSWLQGIGNDTPANDILNKLSPEFKNTFQTLDKLPTKISEQDLIQAIGQPPKSKVSAIKDKLRLEWEIQGTNSNLSVIVSHFDGCIYKTAIGETKDGKLINGVLSFFHRQNKVE